MKITITLTEGVAAPFEKATKEEMDKGLKHFEHELVGIRSGKAHASMIEDLKVSCYGGESELPLKNLASISTPDARTIAIQPWDQGTVPDIERAIRESEAGFSTVSDGSIVRIQLPEMSSARREELIKVLGKKLEDYRITIRGVRKDMQNFIRDEEKSKHISEDFAKKLGDLLQKTTDAYIKKAEDLGAKKEIELKG